MRLLVKGITADQIFNVLNDLTEVDVLLAEVIELLFVQGNTLNQAAFNVTLVKLLNEFKNHLKQAYLNDECWLKIKKAVIEVSDGSIITFSDF